MHDLEHLSVAAYMMKKANDIKIIKKTCCLTLIIRCKLYHNKKGINNGIDQLNQNNGRS